jgi:hypothetical protein
MLQALRASSEVGRDLVGIAEEEGQLGLSLDVGNGVFGGSVALAGIQGLAQERDGLLRFAALDGQIGELPGDVHAGVAATAGARQQGVALSICPASTMPPARTIVDVGVVELEAGGAEAAAGLGELGAQAFGLALGLGDAIRIHVHLEAQECQLHALGGEICQQVGSALCEAEAAAASSR